MTRSILTSSRPLAVVALMFTAFAWNGCGKGPAAVPALDAAGQPLTKVVLQTDWYAQPEHGGFYQAVVKGYYREVGLDVEIQQGGPNAIPTQKVALGTTQFAIGRSDDVMIAVSRGIPLVMVGALMQRDPQAIMFHEESGIRGFKDLDGRNIMAVPGAGWIALTEKKYGIKVSVTPLDFGLSRFLADKKFVQQCFITNEPFYVRQHGAKPATLLLSETGFSPYRVWFTSRGFTEKNPEAVRAFTSASIRGWQDYISGDRTEADALIGSLNKQMVPDFIAYSVGAMLEHRLVTGDPAQGERAGRIDPERIAAQIAQLTSIGVLGKTLTVDDVFDARFLPKELSTATP